MNISRSTIIDLVVSDLTAEFSTPALVKSEGPKSLEERVAKCLKYIEDAEEFSSACAYLDSLTQEEHIAFYVELVEYAAQAKAEEIDRILAQISLEFMDLQRYNASTTVSLLLRWSSFINKCEKVLPDTNEVKIAISRARSSWYAINAQAVTDWSPKLLGKAKRTMRSTIDAIIVAAIQ